MAADIKAGKAFVELAIRDRLAAGLAASAAKLRAYSRVFAGAGAGLLAGAGAIAAPFAGAIAIFSKTGDRLDKMSKRSGLSTETLSELGYAADLSGTSIDALEVGVKKLSRTLYDAERGSTTAADAFAAIGESASELAGLGMEQQLDRVLAGLAGIQEPARRAALAQELFGRSGTELLPMLTDGAEGLAAMREEARRLGLVVSAETAAKAARLTDALGSMRTVARDAFFEIGSGLAPVITTMANALRDAMVPINAFIERNQDMVMLVVPVVGAVASLGVGLLAIAASLRLASWTLGSFAGLSRGLGAVLGLVSRPLVALRGSLVRFGSSLATSVTSGVQRATARIAAMPAAISAAASRGAAVGAATGEAVGRALVRGVGMGLSGMAAIAGRAGTLVGTGLAAVRPVVAATPGLMRRWAAAVGSAATTAVGYGAAFRRGWTGELALATTRGNSIANRLGDGLRTALTRGRIAIISLGQPATWSALATRGRAAIATLSSPAAWSALVNRGRTSITSLASASWQRLVTRGRAAIAMVSSPAAWQQLARSAAASATRAATSWASAANRIRVSVTGAATAGISRMAAMGAAAGRATIAATRGLGRTIGGGIGGLLGSLGMAGSLLGGSLGAGLGSLTLIGPILAGLLNPATLLIGLIAGGVYAWTRWSESGQRALTAVKGFFEPLVSAAKSTFGGMVDAFKAGNLQLAGQIAIAGLRTTILTGLQSLLTLLPASLGPLADWLARLATQLSEGRWSELGETAMAGLSAAWQAGLAGLQSLWGSFTGGVVRAMAAAAGMVAQVWRSTVEGLANWMLSQAAEGGVWGNLMGQILGVDVADEKSKAELVETQRRKVMQRSLEEMIARAERIQAGEGTAKDLETMRITADMSPEDVQAKTAGSLANWRRDLAGLTGPMPDFLGDARDSVSRTMDESQAQIDAALNAWQETADATAAEHKAAAGRRLDEAMAALAPAAEGGRDELARALAEAQRELGEGIARAARERAEAESKARTGRDEGEEELAARAPSAAATFSGFALAQQMGVSSVSQQQLDEQKKSNRNLTRIIGRIEEQIRLDRRRSFVYGA